MRIKHIKWNLTHQRKITAPEGERFMSKAQDFESLIEVSCLDTDTLPLERIIIPQEYRQELNTNP